MSVLFPGGPYFLDNSGATDLKRPLRRWLGTHPNWSVRYDQPQNEWRYSSVEEVAEALVQDPTFQQVLAGLSSPVGQAIEQTALEQWMTPNDAKLMTEALTKAWKIIRNQNVPVWKRGEVLIGVGVVLFIVVGVLVVRHSRN